MSRPCIYMVEIAGSGGIGHYTYNLLAHYGDGVRAVLYTGAPYELADRPGDFAVRTVFRRLRTNPLRVLGMYLDALREHPAVVHFQLSQYPTVVLGMAWLFRRMGVPVVVTAHNVVSHEARRRDRWVFGAVYRMARRLIVHSHHSAGEIGRAFGVPEARIAVIDHGNYMFFGAGEEAVPPPPPARPFRVLFFGYIRPYKGLSVLIDAVARLEPERDVVLEIVGRPVVPFAPYQARIDGLGLGARVRLRLGYVPMAEVQEVFTRASVVVLPYRNISQSGVLQLAYAFGRPVVVTRTGGLPEVVEEGSTGFVVAPDDPEALADRLRCLMDDPDATARMGARARELARTRFSWARIAPLNLAAYGP